MLSRYRDLKKKVISKEINHFDNIILILVGISALCIGLETNKDLVASYPIVFDTIELFFVWLFSIEILVRLTFYFPKWTNYFKDNWNLFDFVIVLITIIPYVLPDAVAQEAISTVRILRLARVFRIFRFISILKPLQLLVSTLASSIPSISYVGVLIAILFYLYGVIGVFQFGDSLTDYFASLPTAFLTLFQILTMEGWSDILGEALEKGHGAFAVVYFISFIIISSIIILNLIIGVIISELESFKEVDARGREKIYCSNHVIILGWSEKINTLLDELSIAQSKSKQVIGILSPKTKNFVKDFLIKNKVKMGSMKIICRCGDPENPVDLDIVNPERAASIIILNKDGVFNDSYPLKIMTILAKKIDLSKVNIALPLLRKHNEDILRFYNTDRIYPAPVNDITARIIAQGTRQPGLTDIYDELLTFNGNEILVADNKSFKGATLSEISMQLKKSYLIGFVNQSGDLDLSPKFDKVIENEKLILVGESESIISLPKGQVSKLPPTTSTRASMDSEIIPEKICILGYNRLVNLVITELDSYMAAGSSIDVYYDPNLTKGNVEPSSYNTRSNLNFIPMQTDAQSEVTSIEVNKYDYFLILSYIDKMTPQDSDMLSFVTWNYLRARLNELNSTKHILVQMSDANPEIISYSDSTNDRFITIDKVESHLLAQYSQNPTVKAIFEELFDESGSEIYIKAASEYLDINKEYNIHDLLQAFEQKNVAFIGHRLYDEELGAYMPVEINPSRSNKFKYQNKDKVVIVARVQYDEMESSATAS